VIVVLATIETTIGTVEGEIGWTDTLILVVTQHPRALTSQWRLAFGTARVGVLAPRRPWSTTMLLALLRMLAEWSPWRTGVA